MNDRGRATAITLSIAAVERDTGLSKDTLRVWERRYGFPAPRRDTLGERAYSIEQVERLRVIKRLLDAGHRPGRIVPLPFDELRALSASTVDTPQRGLEAVLDTSDLRAHLALIRSHDVAALRAELTRLLSRFGVARFVNDVVGRLNAAVGDAWMRGQLEIFEEHAYTEAMQTVLRQAIAGLPEPPADAEPRVLMTTFPGEPHALGLLMLEAVLALEGCRCVSLGAETPLWDIAMGAAAHRADIVALSFTGCMNPGQIVDGLAELRRKLPASTRLWAGGSAPAVRRRRVDGVEAFDSLHEMPEVLRHWRSERARTPSGSVAT